MKSDPTKIFESIPTDDSRTTKITLSEVARLPTSHGHFEVRVVKDSSDTEHVIIYKGTIENADILDVRVHSECLTGEVFASLAVTAINSLVGPSIILKPWAPEW